MSLSAKQRNGLESYLNVIASIRAMIERHERLDHIVKSAIDESGYLDYLKEDLDTYRDRKENLDELIATAAEWHAAREDTTLAAFLEELSLKSSTERIATEGALTLMTLHNAKGLEFDTVFLVGMEEDLLPHINSKLSPDALEEERRLCYVGMTRAKRRLFLSRSTYRVVWGSPRSLRPSRFLSEIPSDYLVTLGENEEEEYGEGVFHEGARVFHKDFGIGIVEASYDSSLGLTYDVFFPDEGITRSLVAQYARLAPPPV